MHPADASPTQEDAASPIRIPSRWTALTAFDPPHIGTTWCNSDPPIELLTLPSDINIQPKLAEILNWSLQRPSKTAPATPWDLFRQIDPQDAVKASDRDETVKRCIGSLRARRSASLERSFPGLRAAKSDLKSALDRIKTLKQKHEVERAASLRQRKEEQHKIEMKEATAECTSCFEDLPVIDVFKLTCNHSYCKPCLSTLIMTALQNESAFPPKCCLSEVPPETVIIPLDSKQRELYKEKAAEYSIPANRRWYCPNTACTKWIPPTKLQRNRMALQRCPHCSTKICSICCGIAHDNVDCPQDFGLEATLDIAEFEGWKRCYSCRTMVERQEGCRHITCKCRAEFCYVCGAKWRTCHCTEVDAVNRQVALQRQRADRDATAQAEADEVARAIAAVEALARGDEERRQQRELQRELDQKQEEIELARLEVIRLQEEDQRRREEEQAEQQLREVLRLSVQEECDAMNQALQRIFHHQHIAVDNRHGRCEQQLLQDLDKLKESQTRTAEQLQTNIARNIGKRTERLKTRHETEQQALRTRHEEEEDDVFLQIQLHLRGKTNRDAREKRLQDELHKQQACTHQQLEAKHKLDMETLENTATMELEGIRRSLRSREHLGAEEHQRKLAQLCRSVAIERSWFHTICDRRKEMVGAHNRIIVEDFEAGMEVVGLTAEMAVRISALPPKPQQNPRLSAHESLQPTPVELEVPSLPADSTKSLAASTQEHKAGLRDDHLVPPCSISSYETAPESLTAGEYLPKNAATGITPACPYPPTVVSDVTENHGQSPLPQARQQHQTPPSPPKECFSPPVPKNGNAYLCTKNGEASKPVCSPPLAPPTPPESPLPLVPLTVDETLRAQHLSVPLSPEQSDNEMKSARAGLHLDISHRLSGASSLGTPLTLSVPASTPTWLHGVSPLENDDNKATKRKPIPNPDKDIEGLYKHGFVDIAAHSSLRKEKSPIRENGAERKPSGASDTPKVKKSRNPFRRRRELTDEEIRERLKKSVGDAFA